MKRIKITRHFECHCGLRLLSVNHAKAHFLKYEEDENHDMIERVVNEVRWEKRKAK